MTIMHFDPSSLASYAIITALVLFALYRRFRRLFGRQPLRPGALVIRIILFSMFVLPLLIGSFFVRELAVALLLGAAVGVGLGMWAAKHTRFEKVGGVLHYIPHTYAGMVVSALFIGRLLYKAASPTHGAWWALTASTEPGAGDFSRFAGAYHNPLTPFFYCVLAGYYIYYYSYVLYESKHLKPKDWEGAALRNEIR
jgi:hypothetical protein